MPEDDKGKNNKNTKEFSVFASQWYVKISWNSFIEALMPESPKSHNTICGIDTSIHVFKGFYPIYHGPDPIKPSDQHKFQPIV